MRSNLFFVLHLKRKIVADCRTEKLPETEREFARHWRESTRSSLADQSRVNPKEVHPRETENAYTRNIETSYESDLNVELVINTQWSITHHRVDRNGNSQESSDQRTQVSLVDIIVPAIIGKLE